MKRVYLDHNATTPLRAEAREAMIAAMDVLGNPSSVHSEGRAAKMLMERARATLAEAMGAEDTDIVFTASATEAAALACSGRGLHGAAAEHDAVGAWVDDTLPVDAEGRVSVTEPGASVLQWANSETGVIQDLPDGIAVSDMTQGFGKLDTDFNGSGARMALVSAHKLGGPKGIGALVLRRGQETPALIKGGGHKMAAGLTVSRDKLEPAMDRLAELLARQGADRMGPRDLALDGVIQPAAADPELIARIEAACAIAGDRSHCTTVSVPGRAASAAAWAGVRLAIRICARPSRRSSGVISVSRPTKVARSIPKPSASRARSRAARSRSSPTPPLRRCARWTATATPPTAAIRPMGLFFDCSSVWAFSSAILSIPR